VPGTGFGVAVVANADWADPYAVMYDALSLFLGADGDAWPEVATDPDTWDAYVGTYEDPYVFGTVDVTRDGGRLTAELVDTGETLRLTQVSGDYFWADSDDYGGLDVRFIQDESGDYTWFVTRPGDTSLDAPEQEIQTWLFLSVKFPHRVLACVVRTRLWALTPTLKIKKPANCAVLTMSI
jgi:hypothetical protein